MIGFDNGCIETRQTPHLPCLEACVSIVADRPVPRCFLLSYHKPIYILLKIDQSKTGIIGGVHETHRSV